jgi:hypothetical protein
VSVGIEKCQDRVNRSDSDSVNESYPFSRISRDF